MFQFDTEGFSALLSGLDELEIDEVAPKMLEESVGIMEKAIRKKAKKHKETGAMVRSIKKTSADKNDRGHFICVRPTGKDAKGVRNMEKMAYLEYGTSTQKATPVITPALNECGDEVIEKMQEVFEREAELE